MNHHDEELYLAEIRNWAREIPFDELKPGDLVVWKFGRTFSHSAIVVDPPIVIHSAVRGSAVFRMNMEQDEDYREGARPRLAFSVFNPDGSLYRPKKRKR
jgi:cell wall-associated NlpC family hydrolase